MLFLFYDSKTGKILERLIIGAPTQEPTPDLWERIRSSADGRIPLFVPHATIEKVGSDVFSAATRGGEVVLRDGKVVGIKWPPEEVLKKEALKTWKEVVKARLLDMAAEVGKRDAALFLPGWEDFHQEWEEEKEKIISVAQKVLEAWKGAPESEPFK